MYNTQIPVSGPPQMQYRPRQAMRGQFTPLSGPPQPPGPYGYTQTTVYPMRQPSPGPVCIVRAPAAVTRASRPQLQSQSVKPCTREKKIIQIKDPNSNRDVTQEILNREPSGRLTDSTGGSPNSVTQGISGQSGSSSAPPFTAQQQGEAEAHGRVQFLTQGAALAVDNEEKSKKPVNYIFQEAPVNYKELAVGGGVREGGSEAPASRAFYSRIPLFFSGVPASVLFPFSHLFENPASHPLAPIETIK